MDQPSMSPSSASSATAAIQARAQKHASAFATDGSPSPTPAHADQDAATETETVDRRRDKPQLSCTFCRRRKVRCDRHLPCNTCVRKGIAFSCTYKPALERKGTAAAGVGERIQQLEALVRSLVHQQQTMKTPPESSRGPFTDSPRRSLGREDTPGASPQSVSMGPDPGRTTPLTSTDEDTIREWTTASPVTHESAPPNKTLDHVASPAPSEPGSMPMRMHSHGVNYVSSVHWAAVLDSISELKDHYEKEKEEEATLLATNDYMPRPSPGPRLLYEPVQATKADILASIPVRPTVDRMIARYFNAQGVAPAILHSDQFLREYEAFWQDPAATSFAWMGLLFSIMCISTQYQQLTEELADADTLRRIHMFRDRTVHCLVLGQFTRGGPHVLETMINYVGSEIVLCKDADIGLWLLVGTLVQLALSLGYHRDPCNFSNISPFAGEMRRRAWATIVQMDLRLSSQMGLPRLLKSQQYDTAEPRNLLDSDFNDTTIELPPSRPETEVTPVLYGLAKNRIDSISGLISDLLADTREHLYPEIMELDRKLREAEASLPPIFQWQPLSQSFMVPPQIVLYRVWLQLALQRLVVWLHRKYLAPCHDQVRCEYSRNACVQAAIKMLEFQQLVDEETQPSGQLRTVRWMQSSLLQSTFLLGMSVLCYYLQLAKTTPNLPLDREIGAKIHDLLRKTYPIWLRSSTVSRDAWEAVQHLSLLLGLRARQEVIPLAQEPTVPFTTPQDTAISLDQVAWETYQECITSFPATFDADFMALDEPGSSSVASVSTTDPSIANTVELDGWDSGRRWWSAPGKPA